MTFAEVFQHSLCSVHFSAKPVGAREVLTKQGKELKMSAAIDTLKTWTGFAKTPCETESLLIAV